MYIYTRVFLLVTILFYKISRSKPPLRRTWHRRAPVGTDV